MPLNVPNLVTWLRITLIPLLIGIFYLPDTWLSPAGKNAAACAVFVVAALSDWLDGYLARVLDQASAFGAFLDPVADKLIVAAALVVLLTLDRVEPLIALIIIGREIAISALREWMAQLGRSRSVAVAYVGKVKTASQMVAIPLLLFHGEVLGVFDAHRVGTVLIYLAAALTVVSMAHYLRRALPHASG
jgi:CDP-diacylglycerol--glycerol-3-phosphate 3-phosphatidyltransferase/cardiolipin synthase